MSHIQIRAKSLSSTIQQMEIGMIGVRDNDTTEGEC
jgi:hypothetical protein